MFCYDVIEHFHQTGPSTKIGNKLLLIIDSIYAFKIKKYIKVPDILNSKKIFQVATKIFRMRIFSYGWSWCSSIFLKFVFHEKIVILRFKQIFLSECRKKFFVFFLFDHVFVIYLGHTWLGGWKFHHFAFCYIPSSPYFLTVVLISKSLIFNFKIQQRREWSAIDSNCALFIVPRSHSLKNFGPWQRTPWLAQIPRPLTHDLQELHHSNKLLTRTT